MVTYWFVYLPLQFRIPRMNKSNARQLLSSTLKKLHQVTGESVGVAFTWKGNLSVLGTGYFQDYINQGWGWLINRFSGSVILISYRAVNRLTDVNINW